MIFDRNDIPASIDTIEKLTVWALTRLAEANASQISISSNNQPVSHVSSSFGTIQAGNNVGKELMAGRHHFFLSSLNYRTGTPVYEVVENIVD